MNRLTIIAAALLALPLFAGGELPEPDRDCDPHWVEVVNCALHCSTQECTQSSYEIAQGVGECWCNCSDGQTMGGGRAYRCDNAPLPPLILAQRVRVKPMAERLLERSDFTVEVWGPHCPLNGQDACEREAQDRCGGDGWPYGQAIRAISAGSARYTATAEGGVCQFACPGHAYSLACNHRDRGLVASY